MKGFITIEVFENVGNERDPQGRSIQVRPDCIGVIAEESDRLNPYLIVSGHKYFLLTTVQEVRQRIKICQSMSE